MFRQNPHGELISNGRIRFSHFHDYELRPGVIPVAAVNYSVAVDAWVGTNQKPPIPMLVPTLKVWMFALCANVLCDPLNGCDVFLSSLANGNGPDPVLKDFLIKAAIRTLFKKPRAVNSEKPEGRQER